MIPKSTSRRAIFGVLAVLFVVGLGVAAYFFVAAEPPRITVENAARIQPGMTLAEVEAIFGVPPGTYSTRELNYIIEDIKGDDAVLRSGKRVCHWSGDDAMVMIALSDDDTVFCATAARAVHFRPHWYRTL